MIVFLILLFLFLFYIYVTWNDGFWEKLGVAFDKPTFFLGNFKDILSRNRHDGVIAADMYKKFDGCPYVGYFNLRVPNLLVRDPDIAKDIIVKDFNSFQSTGFEADPHLDRIMSENPFGHIGAVWKTKRSQWAASLTPSKIKAMYDNMCVRCDKMVAHIKRQSQEPIEARLLGSTFFTNVIVSSVFGIEVDSFENPDNPFTKMSRSMFVSSYIGGLIITLFVRFPMLTKLLRIRFVDKQKEKDLIVMTREILKCQKDNIFLKGDGNNDKSQMATDDKPSDYEYEVAGRVFGFLLEGTETSSGLFSLALYELAYNPYIQEKLRTELDKAAASNGRNISYEDLMHLPYFDMVLSETLRLYPPGLSLQRISNKEYTLPPPRAGTKPVTIPVGTPVHIPIYGMQMDPKYFPDPERFDPNRFTEEAKNSRHKYVYMPFGEGPRVCIGSRLAMIQTKAGIAGIIRNFEIRVSPKTLPKPLKIDPNMLVLAPVGNVWLTFHERSN